MIDMRSDTVTRPTPAMRAAMAAAAVGDDVIDVDPTVDALQQRTAELLGKEAALFMPSGTMCNLVAVRLHCRPGDELICDEGCHIYNYEQSGYAQLNGVAVRTIAGHYGVMEVQQLDGCVRPNNEHMPQTRLLCAENTHNRGGGRIYPLDSLHAVAAWARSHGLATHLDGARLMNAVVATGIEARRWAEPFDTVSICFSKGLGAPVGSALAGSHELIQLARRHRKVFGGAMRQAGIIAAGALYALDHHVERLAEDHRNAQEFARRIATHPAITLDPPTIDTNIVIFRIDSTAASAVDFCNVMQAHGVQMLPFGPQLVRACTHLDVSEADSRSAARLVLQAISDVTRIA